MRINGSSPLLPPDMGKPSLTTGLLAIQYSVLTSLVDIQKEAISLPLTVKAPMGVDPFPPPTPAQAVAALQLLAVFSQIDALYKQPPPIGPQLMKLMNQINDLRPKCDGKMQQILSRVSYDLANWSSCQSAVLQWIQANKPIILQGLTAQGQQAGADGFMNLIWFFTSAMRNPSMKAAIEKELGFSAGGGDVLYSVMAKFVFSYYFTIDSGNLGKIKTDLDLFYKLMPAADPSSNFGKFKSEMDSYMKYVYQSGGPQWPPELDQPLDSYLLAGLSVFSQYLTYQHKVNKEGAYEG